MTQEKLDHAGIIDNVIGLLDRRYIFADVGEKMIALLRERLPAYERISDVEEFARTVTEDLQSISHDKHLHMDYNPASAAVLIGAGEEDELAAMQEWIKILARINYGFHRLEWLQGGIGYLDLRSFAPPSVAGDIAAAAMTFLSNSRAIIFDIRKNGGGMPQMVQLLITYLYDDFDIRHLNTFYTRYEDKYTHFWTLPYVPGKHMPDVDVYVLTSSRTFSGGEEFAYNLKTMNRATLIGETTGGGANPGETYGLNEQFTIFVPSGRAINPITQTNWEGVGVEPHISVPAEDALRVAHITALEKLIERATGDDERKELTEALEKVRNA